MSDINWLGYPASGVPRIGLSDDGETLFTRSYVLWGGRRPKEEYGPARCHGPVPEHLREMARAALIKDRRSPAEPGWDDYINGEFTELSRYVDHVLSLNTWYNEYAKKTYGCTDISV